MTEALLGATLLQDAAVATWLGAAAGMSAASGAAVGLAVLARRRVPDVLLRRLVGALLVLTAARG